MASGWNIWVWLVGVVVRKHINFLIILLIPSLVYISSFFAAASLLLCSFLKCFFRSCL